MKIMKKEYLRYGFTCLFLLICGFALLISCGGSGGGGGVEGEPEPGSLALGLSQAFVKSDNSDSTTVTATVLDEFNAAMEEVAVAFSASGGQLSASSMVTDANGEARVTFSSGQTKKNRVETITAEITGVSSRNVPVQVTGTTITLVSDTSSLEIGGADTAVLTITVMDAMPSPIWDTPVSVSIHPDSTANATLTIPDPAKTDFSGEMEVMVTGVEPQGIVTVEVKALGATAVKDYEVGAAGDVFGITGKPEEGVESLEIGSFLIVEVSAPGLTLVVFGTTLGVWDRIGSAVTKSVGLDGNVSAILTADQAGTATVQVYDFYSEETSDTLMVAIYAPSTQASQIAFQASSAVVAPSTGTGGGNTVTLEATVKNSTDQVVGGAPVIFTIETPTGGGETISPAIVYTDTAGVASTTFTSGSLSSGAEGVKVKASVIGAVPAIESEISIVIGGTAGSIVIGLSPTMSAPSETTYKLPVSLLVSDSNGNPVSGAQVSLGLWPIRYSTGWWVEVGKKCLMESTGTWPNEDANRNLILDPGEDIYPNQDGSLTPPNSAAGSLPTVTVTDEFGVANFDLYYLKYQAGWIDAELKATTFVLGTETQSTQVFSLPYLSSEACVLKNAFGVSPYGVGPAPPPE